MYLFYVCVRLYVHVGGEREMSADALLCIDGPQLVGRSSIPPSSCMRKSSSPSVKKVTLLAPFPLSVTMHVRCVSKGLKGVELCASGHAHHRESILTRSLC